MIQYNGTMSCHCDEEQQEEDVDDFVEEFTERGLIETISFGTLSLGATIVSLRPFLHLSLYHNKFNNERERNHQPPHPLHFLKMPPLLHVFLVRPVLSVLLFPYDLSLFLQLHFTTLCFCCCCWRRADARFRKPVTLAEQSTEKRRHRRKDTEDTLKVMRWAPDDVHLLFVGNLSKFGGDVPQPYSILSLSEANKSSCRSFGVVVWSSLATAASTAHPAENWKVFEF